MTKNGDFFWDGYLHWAHAVEDAAAHPDFTFDKDEEKPDQTRYEPIFIKVNNRIERENLQEIGELISRNIGEPNLLEEIANYEQLSFLHPRNELVVDFRDLLIGITHSFELGVPLEFFVYRPAARTNEEHDKFSCFFGIMDVGATAFAVRQPNRLSLDIEPSAIEIPEIGAVIDNDIGFLNRRFRQQENGMETTRIAALWLQSRRRFPTEEKNENTALPDTPLAEDPQGNYVPIGRVLLKRQIDRIIKDDTRDEAAIYSEINSELHSWERFRRVPPLDSHGTAVMDLAFGADFEDNDPLSEVPLLAVQLPPEAAVDTSGTYSESYIVQGVRTICAWAREIAGDAVLTINISYGALAGQKDGGKFLEAQIAREVKIASQAYDQTVQIVYAFGNGRNERQVAKLQIGPNGDTETIDWRIQPDNPVPSFLEIRALDTGRSKSRRTADIPSDIKVTLYPPDGGAPLEAQPAPGSAQPPLGSKPGVEAARVYHVPNRTPSPRPVNSSYLTVAIAPTRRMVDELPPAEAGDWRLKFQNLGEMPIELVLQIQRGDTAPGFSLGGRQSHFVGDYEQGTNCGIPDQDVVAPLTNKGTNSAFVTAVYKDQIDAVGALKSVYDQAVPTDYSAQGADWTGISSPTDCKVVDQIFTFGVRAAGMYSGTQTRLSGTSAAAALKSHSLVTKNLSLRGIKVSNRNML